MSDRWTAGDVPEMDGEVVAITGANSGIGYEAARVFAARGATVVMAVRSVERGEAAAGEIRGETPDADIDVRECDLAALASVASFAESFASDYGELRALCNNAGVMAVPRSKTADGFERQFGVNHLGHFALTGHLLETLATTAGESRVVTQSSGLHEQGTIDFDSLALRAGKNANGEPERDDLQGDRSYDRWAAYGQSKLANVLFGYELQRRLAEHDVDGVTSVVCHPGYADTDLQYRGPRQAGSRLRLAAMRVANAVFAQPPERGALPLLYAATAEDLSGGEYVGPGGVMNMRGYPEVQASSAASQDRETAARLWEVSAELTGVEYGFDRL